jgi:hypothetical protein
MSSTSSEDSDLARFAAVAVTGNQIEEGAVKSAQVNRATKKRLEFNQSPRLAASEMPTTYSLLLLTPC